MMRPIDSPHQSPTTPRPSTKQSTYPVGSPTNQWPTRFQSIGVRVSLTHTGNTAAAVAFVHNDLAAEPGQLDGE